MASENIMSRRRKTFYVFIAVIVQILFLVAITLLVMKTLDKTLTSSLFLVIPTTLVMIPTVIIGAKGIYKDIGYSFLDYGKLEEYFKSKSKIMLFFLKGLFSVFIIFIGCAMGFVYIATRGDLVVGVLLYALGLVGTFFLYKHLNVFIEANAHTNAKNEPNRNSV